MSDEISSLRGEMEEMRRQLATVTEAVILYQEFIEGEVGVMTYFRDCGCFSELAGILNKLRVPRPLQLASPCMKTPTKMKNQTSQNANVKKRLNFNEQGQDNLEPLEPEDEEQIEVDVNVDEGVEEKSTNEITISKVESIPPSLASELWRPFNQRLQTAPATASSTGLMEKVMQEQQLLYQQHLLQQQKYWQSPVIGLPYISNANFGLLNQHIVNNAEQCGDQQSPMDLVSAGSCMKSQKGKSGKSKREKSNQNVKKNVTGKNNVKNVKNVKSTLKGNSCLPIKTAIKRPRSDSFQCPQCPKAYTSKGVLSRHMKEAHAAEPQFLCFYCPEKFRTGPLRLTHMTATHPEDCKSVICPYCDRKSTTATGKRNHMMLCPNRPPHVGVQHQDVLPNGTESSSSSASPP